MPYTPELNKPGCTTLRRLSWAIGEPMTRTIQEIMKVAPLLIDSGKACDNCKDKSKCEDCYFNSKKKEEFASEHFTGIGKKDRTG